MSKEKEAKLKADSIAAAEKREEERRIKEVAFANAATVLQAASRRMIARRNYSAIKTQHIFASAACIQSLARGIMVRRRVKAQISSIVLAQAYARGTIIRNRKKAAEVAIVPLQAIVRGHIDRKRVKVIKWYLAKSSKSKSFASFAPKGDNATRDMVHPSDSNDDSTVTFNDYDYDDEYNFEGCKPTMENNGFDIDPKGFAKDLRNFVEEQGIASAFMSFFA